MSSTGPNQVESLPLSIAEVLWHFDELPVQALEGLAVDALSRGFDGPALRELAWSHDSWSEVGELFRKALAELGRPAITTQEAITRLIRWNAAKIVNGEVSPFEGARRMFYDVWWKIPGEQSGQYESIIQPLRWANVFEDNPTEREAAARQIVERARQLLEADPRALSDQVSQDTWLAPWEPGQLLETDVALMVHEVAPDFHDRWVAYLIDWRRHDPGTNPPGLCLFMMEFAGYVGDSILADSGTWMPVFSLVERLMSEGNEEVKTATATCFLESLINRDAVPTSAYVPLLGPLSREHCRAWDSFTGVRTEGL